MAQTKVVLIVISQTLQFSAESPDKFKPIRTEFNEAELEVIGLRV